MKKIVTGSQNLTKLDAANMMIATATDIKSCDGLIITVDKWVQMQDTDTGAYVMVISDKDGAFYATISNVFQQAFLTAAEQLGDMTDVSVQVIKATSKQGRNFFSLKLVRE